MNFKIVNAFCSTLANGIRQISKKKAPVVAEEIVQVAKKSTAELRKETIQKYLSGHFATPVKDAEQFATGKMLQELVNPKNQDVRIICYPARTVVDMKKTNGTFVRRVYDKSGKTIMKEKTILPDGTTKDWALTRKKTFETKPATRGSEFFTEQTRYRAVKRDADGHIIQTKDRLLTKEFDKNPWSGSQYEVGAQDIIHTKNYENGKHLSGKVKKHTTYADIGDPTFNHYSVNPANGPRSTVPIKTTTTVYNVPGKIQKTGISEWDYTMVSRKNGGKKKYSTTPVIKELTSKTLEAASK